jgi:hypothetical protein
MLVLCGAQEVSPIDVAPAPIVRQRTVELILSPREWALQVWIFNVAVTLDGSTQDPKQKYACERSHDL